MTVNLSLSDRIVDLHSEQVDVALRSTSAQSDSSLLARKVADTDRVICASPAYLERFGTPRTPADLARHHAIIFSLPFQGHTWPFRTADGRVEHVEVSGPIITDNSECAIQLALAGVGMIRIGEMLVSGAIKNRRLAPLLLDCHDADRLTTWAVFPAGLQKVPRVRTFVDFLVEYFGRP